MSLSTSAMGPPTVWLITGASTGLGLALTKRAIERGDFVLASARDTTRFDPFLAELDSQTRARVHTLKLDVTAPLADIQHVVQEGLAVWGRIDCIVNNAGLLLVGASEEIGAEGMMQLMQTNFAGVINVTNAVLPHLRQRRTGTVIIVGSRSAFRNEFTGVASYAASKAAVHSYGETLSAELKPFGIRVMIVVPGTFGQPMSIPPVPPKNPHADYDAARKAMAAFLEAMKHNKTGGDPLKGMDVVVDVVKGEGKAEKLMQPGSGCEWPLWLLLGEDCIRDVKARLENMGNVLEAWKEVGSGLSRSDT